MKEGQLYIISAPSGAGKTSLVRQLLTDLEQITVSVSHTTRSVRTGERNGVDYLFVTNNEFKKMIVDQEFIEHAQVFDNYYGTARQSVKTQLENGIDVILEIDWQGAKQVRKILKECISIFILPPSIAVLQKRLDSRGQDSVEVIKRRMLDAVNEMSHYNEYDYLIVNDDFNQALGELKSIITSHRLKIKRQLKNMATLLHSLTRIRP